ncbi:hypothetical protein, partial [Roseibaca sp. Y0-43]|uniref:hypothetical protein n=1 Tax=Roseibaca sp. Y0-43 TaxID=2816854 RepID=UPI001D0CDAD3
KNPASGGPRLGSSARVGQTLHHGEGFRGGQVTIQVDRTTPRIENPRVGGSIPPLGTIFLK